MSQIKLAKFLASQNKELIEKTGIRDCHCLGLHSFIINEKPRIRLFIAEKGSELHDPWNIKIPIHAHKYDDQFVMLRGSLNNYFYDLKAAPGAPAEEMLKYEYLRVGDKKHLLRSFGTHTLYLKEKHTLYQGDTFHQPAKILHTAATAYNGFIAWMIIEMDEDKDFKQAAYFKCPPETRPELYKPFKNASNYVNYMLQKIDWE